MLGVVQYKLTDYFTHITQELKEKLQRQENEEAHGRQQAYAIQQAKQKAIRQLAGDLRRQKKDRQTPLVYKAKIHFV